MTSPWIDTIKPAAPARIHLLLAAVLWSAVGAALMAVGARWELEVRTPVTPWLIAAAVAGGWLKARWVLARTGRRIAGRIAARGDGRCIGGFLSLPSWALVLVMVVAGRLLRGGLLARHLVGLLYVLVGTGLLVASRVLWRAWTGSRPHLSAGAS
jgi:hypothetical protein